MKLPTKEHKMLSTNNIDYKTSKDVAKAKRGAVKAELASHGANRKDHLDGAQIPEDLTRGIKEASVGHNLHLLPT